MQNSKIFSKMVENSFKSKNYILPSGKIVKIQGYENKCLDTLLEIYNEEDIIIQPNNLQIIYIEDNKKHIYYPDFFIPKENLILEVKSVWTYKSNEKNNLLKMNSCINKGFNFKFYIYK